MRGLLFLVAGTALMVLWAHFTDRSVRSTRIWRPSAPGFVSPELSASVGNLSTYLKARANFGIALAGGGTRGMALAHGAVRSLRKAGILNRTRYLSTTSGSIWLGIPLYYQTQDDLDEFLGESLRPSELHPEVLAGARMGTLITRMPGVMFSAYAKGVHPNGSATPLETPALAKELKRKEAERQRHFEALVELDEGTLDRYLKCARDEDWCSCLVDHASPFEQLDELWNIAVAYIFLHPFGLAKPGSSHCHQTEYRRIRRLLGNSSTIYVARDQEEGLPFLLSQSAVLAPLTDPVVAFPLEHTPLYTGVTPAFTGAQAAPYEALGDVLVEPFAWPGAVLDKVPDRSESKVLIRGDLSFLNAGQLGLWSGAVTSYVADFQIRPWTTRIPKCTKATVEKVLPHARMWSPLAVDGQEIPVSEEMAIGDAGIYDDLGHLPLLRRGVKKLVIVDSSAVHDNETGVEKENLCQMVYTLAAFGQPGCLHPASAPGAPNPEMAAGFSTVFEPSEFGPLWAEIQAKHAAGEPAVIRGKYTVVENARFGIKGGWQVEIVWVIALPVARWRAALPKDTAAALRSYFPGYLATEATSRMELAAISQLGSWLFEDVALREIHEMLQGEDNEGEVETIRQADVLV